MNHFQIRPEERVLGSLFAQEYANTMPGFDDGYNRDPIHSPVRAI